MAESKLPSHDFMSERIRIWDEVKKERDQGD